jgi:hypothetical protein
VPSAAFLDATSRWNAVVFMERLRPSLGEVLVSRRSVLSIRPQRD